MSQLNIIAFLHIIMLKLLHYEDIVNYFSDHFYTNIFIIQKHVRFNKRTTREV